MALDTIEEEVQPIIKVIGVGGGGGNAANYMYKRGITDVDFVVCNTDRKALNMSPIPNKIMLGEKGLGAGNKPEIGRQAAIESMPDIMKILEPPTEMVFVTAGMGGGTGTGAAPVIARAAKDKGILTVGIVTIPFVFEGKNRLRQAIEGVEEMRRSVDAIIIITNERIKELYGNLSLSEAFSKADTVLTTAAKGIAELITVTGYINVDMNDVRTVLTNSGDAIMGSAIERGEGRALRAIQAAIDSPLLTNCDISASDNVLLNISTAHDEYEVSMDEVTEITDYLQDRLKPGAQMIWGNTYIPELEDGLQVTLVVTGLNLTEEDLSERRSSSTAQPAAAEEKKESTIGKVLDLFQNKKEDDAAKAEPEMRHLSDDEAAQKATALYGSNVLNGNKNQSYATPLFTVQDATTQPVDEEQHAESEDTTEPEVEAAEEKKTIKFNLDDLDIDANIDRIENGE